MWYNYTMEQKESKILFFDIETSPNLGYTWGKWEQNVIEFKEQWSLMCYAYKWLGEKTTHVVALPDFTGYKKGVLDDKKITKSLWDLFNEADVIIAHNGDSFDIKKSTAKFIEHGFKPPTPYVTIDTKKVAKRYFKFESNKLDDLGKLLKVGQKLDTGGFDLWLCCMSGDEKAWRDMCKYNKQDVVLLEKVYLALRPWMRNHPNLALMKEDRVACPNCSSKNVQKRGKAYTRASEFQRWLCNDCHSWHQSPFATGSQIR